METTREQSTEADILDRIAVLLEVLKTALGGMINLESPPSRYKHLETEALPGVVEGLSQFAGSRPSHCVHICLVTPGSSDEPPGLTSFLGHDVSVGVTEEMQGLRVISQRYTRPDRPESLEFPVDFEGAETYISYIPESLGRVEPGKVGQVVIATFGPQPRATLLTVPPVDRP